MMRSSWFTLAYALLLGAAGPLAACASNSAQAQETPQTQAPPAAAQTSGYSDAQVQGYVASRAAIEQIAPGQSPEQQAANRQRIGQILQQNGLTGEQFNAIAAASRTDQALANRIAAISVGTNFSDAQLRSFVQASTEIEPLNQSLARATPEQRTQAAQQIRDVLARNSLNAETYNGIAARAQSDPQLAQRIAQIQAEASQTTAPQGSSGED